MIEWHKVTWYSWALAAFVFLLFLPGMTFYIGMEYQKAKSEGALPGENDRRGEEIACTMEAKICPDGSAVGRTGPHCEFAPCPAPTPTPVVPIEDENTLDGGLTPPPSPIENPSGKVACTMEAKICPDGSAVGRTGPNCEFAPCFGEEPSSL